MTSSIEQYCSVCKAVLAMTVVPTSDGDEDGVLWLRCPQCHGFLPKISDGLGSQARQATASAPAPADPAPVSLPDEDDDADDDAEDTVATGAAAAPAPPPAEPLPEPFPDIDPAAAVPYRPWNSYAVGDVIHHLAWDDYGIVRGKENLPGGRRAVKVQFEQAGIVRLIEESDEPL